MIWNKDLEVMDLTNIMAQNYNFFFEGRLKIILYYHHYYTNIITACFAVQQ